MPINGEAFSVWIAEVVVVGGVERLQLSDEEAATFNADPDAFAAKHVGLSGEDYAEWIELEGCPRCGGRTKSGAPCRMQVAGMSDAAVWKAKHRKLYCANHGGSS